MNLFFKSTVFLMLVLLLSSCETDLKEPELVIVETNYDESVLIVNGISGLSSEEGITVFSNGAKLNGTPVKYANTSESYIDVNKGENTFSLKIGGEDTSATLDYNIEAGKLHTLYLCGSKDNPVFVIKEDVLDFESIEHKHRMQMANLSEESTEGLDLEVYVMGYETVVENGFHIATGPYGLLTNYAEVTGIPQTIKYKEVVSSQGFASNSLVTAFPYRFVKSGTNTADISQEPIPQSTGEFFVGQELIDLAQGNITNFTLFEKDAITTTVVAGTSMNDDRVTFNYNNTKLYNNK